MTWKTAALGRLSAWQSAVPGTRYWELRSDGEDSVLLEISDAERYIRRSLTLECAEGSACDVLDMAAEDCIERLKA